MTVAKEKPEFSKEFYGIDLGTTYSCIATLDENGLVMVLPNKEGQMTTPSVVSFEDNGNILVGRAAKAQLSNRPDCTVAFIKREMSNKSYQMRILGKTYDPVEISSMILKKLVTEANRKRQDEEDKDPIYDVVITVPAYFGNLERQRTIAAGVKAGLNVLAIINEPTAAALSYSQKRKDNKTFLVYDLGGGTFDVSILQLKNYVMNTLSTDGDHRLGGADWDMEIIKYALNKANLNVSFDELTPQEQGMLRLAAEECKQLLTDQESAVMQFAYRGIQTVEISRAEFERQTLDLMDRTMLLLEHAMELAGNPRLDEVLLVGGSSRMPMVKKMVEEKLGIKPKLVDPDMAVAKGAALYAGQEEGGHDESVNSNGGGIQVGEDKGSRSYGVMAYDEHNKERVFNLILRTDNLEVEKEFTSFKTREEGQSGVEFHFYESSVEDSVIALEEAEELKGKTGSINWGKPAPKGTPIRIVAKRDRNGVVRVFVECNGAKGEFEILSPGCGFQA